MNERGYDENFKIAADYDLWSRLLRKGYGLASTDEVSVAIRFHEQSLSIIEKGRRDRQEMSRIMRDNINHLTQAAISDEAVQLLWELIYDSAHLSCDQFAEAITILQSIYNKMKPHVEVAALSISKVRRRMERTVYMKKIFAFIAHGDRQGVRLTALGYIHRHGALSLFSIIWIFSFLGMEFLHYLPTVYEKFKEKWTRFQLMGILNE